MPDRYGVHTSRLDAIAEANNAVFFVSAGNTALQDQRAEWPANAVVEDRRGLGDERSCVARAAPVADGTVGRDGKEAVAERGLRRARAAEMGNIGLDAGAEAQPAA